MLGACLRSVAVSPEDRECPLHVVDAPFGPVAKAHQRLLRALMGLDQSADLGQLYRPRSCRQFLVGDGLAQKPPEQGVKVPCRINLAVPIVVPEGEFPNVSPNCSLLQPW